MVQIDIQSINSFCPVQAEGTIDGKQFYFRARGSSWSMSIGGADVILNPEWWMEEHYGNWPDAGYITEDEALAFISKAAEKYATRILAQ